MIKQRHHKIGLRPKAQTPELSKADKERVTVMQNTPAQTVERLELLASRSAWSERRSMSRPQRCFEVVREHEPAAEKETAPSCDGRLR